MDGASPLAPLHHLVSSVAKFAHSPAAGKDHRRQRHNHRLAYDRISCCGCSVFEIEGSLFFDITHATGGHPGPQDLRPHIPTIWEVHPVTNIVFEP
jgi:hypothetical protein